MEMAGSDQVTGVDGVPARPVLPDAKFRRLFDDHAPYVSASLRRLGIGPVDRDDLVAEVFVRVHRELDRYDPRRQVRPWLFAFAARVASEHRRLARHRREVLSDDLEGPSNLPAPDRNLEVEEARRLVDHGLAALDFEKRVVFVLSDLDETTVPEIARVLGIAEGTAYSRLRAARTEFTAAIRRQQLIDRSSRRSRPLGEET
jgi:RNA polymerase sigma-70 factor (ECF subfamily)